MTRDLLSSKIQKVYRRAPSTSWPVAACFYRPALFLFGPLTRCFAGWRSMAGSSIASWGVFNIGGRTLTTGCS